HFGRVAVETEDETAVHRDAVGLDFLNRGEVVAALARFPIIVQLDALEAELARAFQADEDLLAAGVTHETEQIVVLSHFYVRFGDAGSVFKCPGPADRTGASAPAVDRTHPWAFARRTLAGARARNRPAPLARAAPLRQ